MMELVESSPERSAPPGLEAEISTTGTPTLRPDRRDPGESLRQPKETLQSNQIPCARTQDAFVDDTAHAIHGACRVPHQLGAIRPPYEDSDHCVLSEGPCTVTNE